MVYLETIIFYLFTLLVSCVSNEMEVSISTHVLDTALGRPAEGIPTILERLEPEKLKLENVTSEDGRIKFPDGSFTPGTYKLRFEVADYFAKRNVSTLYPYIDITFVATGGHYHIPLLLAPHGYSTYRGS